MKPFLLIFTALLILTSCSHKKVATISDLPSNLVQELDQIQKQIEIFDKSEFGALCKSAKKDLEKFELRMDLEKPIAGNLAQALCSVKIIRQMGLQMIQTLDSKKLSKTKRIKMSLDYFNRQVPIVFEQKLTEAEILIYLISFYNVAEKAIQLKNWKLNSRIRFLLWGEMRTKKEEIAARTLKHDILVVQSLAYSLNAQDWQQLGSLNDSEPRTLTNEEIKIISQINKYEEILHLESLKNLSTSNMDCLEKNQCHLCDLQVSTNTCAELNDLKNAKENKSILSILANKPEQFLVQFSKRIENFSTLFKDF